MLYLFDDIPSLSSSVSDGEPQPPSSTALRFLSSEGPLMSATPVYILLGTLPHDKINETPKTLTPYKI